MVDLKALAEQNRQQRIVQNEYPGRGIVIGLTPSGAGLIQAYWVMGRSQNSQNRVLVRDADVVRTQPYDPAKCTDPSLIIYQAMARYEHLHIVSNGDQTDTILDALQAGSNFESALRTRQFEPDPPNYTPRISGVLAFDSAHPTYKLSVLKASLQNPDYPASCLFEYSRFVPGFGHCIHTYQQNGDPIPSFEGEPYLVPLPEHIGDIASYYWESLDTKNRVSLVVKRIDASSEQSTCQIINKWE